MQGKSPTVSVCVVTYNQKKYIAQCLQSLMDQSVDFDYEVIVSDDCSSDGTSEVVAEYAKTFPSCVIHIRHVENLGAYKNYQFVHQFAQKRGKYIAHVDGDDYVLPGKLAAQVAVLDSHPNIAMSTHAVKVEGQDRVIGGDTSLPELCGLDDLLRLGAYFANSSIMYRAINTFTHDEDLDIIDFYVHIEQASRGLIHLNKLPLGVYRWNSVGISKNEMHRQRIENAYEEAFNLALRLNAPTDLVNRCRLAKRKSFAVARLMIGDVKGFNAGIVLGLKDFKYASVKHFFLSLTRFVPFNYFVVKSMLRLINK